MSSNYGAVWRVTLSTAESTWVVVGTLQSLAIFLKVDNNRFFFAGKDTDPISDNEHIFSVFEWGNPTPIWQNLRGIHSNRAGSRIQNAKAVLSEDKQIVYSIVGQDK